ncbi:hypothetical protein ACFQ60_23095 [Streptomyces zhihengii]
MADGGPACRARPHPGCGGGDGRLPADVATRLGELGYTLPPGVEFTEG